MCAGCRTGSRCTGPTWRERAGVPVGGVAAAGRLGVALSVGRGRGGVLSGAQTLCVPAGVERRKVPFFHCHLALVFTSGQQLGTEPEE